MTVFTCLSYPESLRSRSSSSVCYTANATKNRRKNRTRRKNEANTALTPCTPSEILPLWLDELQVSDRAKDTIRRYKSAVEGFLACYERCEQRP
jgi:hypothetical protein